MDIHTDEEKTQSNGVEDNNNVLHWFTNIFMYIKIKGEESYASYCSITLGCHIPYSEAHTYYKFFRTCKESRKR